MSGGGVMAGAAIGVGCVCTGWDRAFVGIIGCAVIGFVGIEGCGTATGIGSDRCGVGLVRETMLKCFNGILTIGGGVRIWIKATNANDPIRA